MPDLDSNPGLDNDTVDTVQEHDRVSRTNGSNISLDHLQRRIGKLQRPEKNLETRTFENNIAKPKGDLDQVPKRRSSVRFCTMPSINLFIDIRFSGTLPTGIKENIGICQHSLYGISTQD